MQRRRVVVRHAVLLQDAQLVGVALAEEGVELRIADLELSAVRKRHDRPPSSALGLEGRRDRRAGGSVATSCRFRACRRGR